MTNPPTAPQNTIEINRLPHVSRIRQNVCYRLANSETDPKYTHYLFKFPARFHTPVVRWILDQYASEPNKTVLLDCFNGSGTTQVEANVRGIPSIGVDIDAVSTFVTRAKVQPIDGARLWRQYSKISSSLASLERPKDEYQTRIHPEDDISESQFQQETLGMCLPEIENIQHWFRRYVLVDLYRIRSVIQNEIRDVGIRRFFLAVFAASIRNSSNADPDTISGLEYTKVMKERDEKGRIVNPFSIFHKRAIQAIDGMRAYYEACDGKDLALTIQGDALDLKHTIGNSPYAKKVNLIITSPPYLTAVDYHTRHKLEAFWLGLTDTGDAYRTVAHRYMGRRRVLKKDAPASLPFDLPRLERVLHQIAEEDSIRAGTFRNYFSNLEKAFEGMSSVLKPGGTAVVAVGDSTSGGEGEWKIETQQFAREIAKLKGFTLQKSFSYEIRNRYMHYSRHNGANINREWLLIFNRR